MTKIISRIFFITSLVVAFSFGLSACSIATKTQPIPSPTNAPRETEYSYVASVSGQTALDLLKQHTDIQVKEYEFGTFIEGINGVMSDEKQYWAFYINNEYAQEAADKIVVNPGDTIKFRLEPIEAFPTQQSEK